MSVSRQKTWLVVLSPLPSTPLVPSAEIDIEPQADKITQKGPEIRTGLTVGEADFPITAGLELNLTTDDKYATACDDKNL